MGSLRNTRKTILLCLFLPVFLAGISPSASSKLYVVYMGSKGSDDPDEILRANHQMLTTIHKGSDKEARDSHVYSYRHGFRGFAAKLSEEQASEVVQASTNEVTHK